MSTYINHEAQKQVTSYHNFDSDNIEYKPAKLNARGGKNIPVHYEGKRLLLQIPLTFTWGAQEHEDDNGNKSYSMNLNIEQESKLFEKMKAFEDKIIADSVKNSKAWFGKPKMTEAVVDALFYRILKFPKDKNTDEIDTTRNPNMKVKIPYWDGKFTFKSLFNMEKHTIYSPSQGITDNHPTELIPQRSHISAVIECGGVWFAAGRFGVTWKLVQGKVKKPVTMDGYCMLDDPEEDLMVAEINKKAKQKSSEEEEDTAYQAEELVDTEDETGTQEEEEPEPEPQPEPKKKKKVVRKKKATA